MTPKGQALTQVPQPLHTSCCTTTEPYSERKIAPVGQTSRQPALVQCLHTSEDISQRNSGVSGGVRSTSERSPAGVAPRLPEDFGPIPGMPRLTSLRPDSRASSIRSWPCSTKATWRQVFAPSSPVLS